MDTKLAVIIIITVAILGFMIGYSVAPTDMDTLRNQVAPTQPAAPASPGYGGPSPGYGGPPAGGGYGAPSGGGYGAPPAPRGGGYGAPSGGGYGAPAPRGGGYGAPTGGYGM